MNKETKKYWQMYDNLSLCVNLTSHTGQRGLIMLKAEYERLVTFYDTMTKKNQENLKLPLFSEYTYML